jgi:hypothetical protein
MDYLQYLPIDIYKEILFLLGPDQIYNICLINKYTKETCDNHFYKEYIIRNYNPDDYMIELWDNDILENKNFNHKNSKADLLDYPRLKHKRQVQVSWKDILNRLNYTKIITGEYDNQSI